MAQSGVITGEEGGHTHQWISDYEAAHVAGQGHREFRKCTGCGKVEYTGYRNVAGCKSCCSHASWQDNYEAAHIPGQGHRKYRKCMGCGLVEYTGFRTMPGCAECHVHAWQNDYEAAHVAGQGHREFRKCTGCGKVEYTGYRKIESCAGCYPVLPAPTLLAPMSGAEVSWGSVTVRWSSVPEAKCYKVALRDLSTNEKLLDGVETTATSFKIATSQLVEGHEYRVAVASSAAGATDGWSLATFRMARAEAPLVILEPRVTDITETSAVFRWSTNYPTNTWVTVDGTIVAGREENATSHEVAVSGLLPGKPHNAELRCKRGEGMPVATATLSFDTPLSLRISSFQIVNLSQTNVTFTWSTNAEASSWVQIEGKRHGQDESTKQHQVTVSGLLPGKTYSALIQSRRSPGEAWVEQGMTFQMLGLASPQNELGITLGVYSQVVAEAQTLLRKLDFGNIAVDGLWGPLTAASMRQFQTWCIDQKTQLKQMAQTDEQYAITLCIQVTEMLDTVTLDSLRVLAGALPGGQPILTGETMPEIATPEIVFCGPCGKGDQGTGVKRVNEWLVFWIKNKKLAWSKKNRMPEVSDDFSDATVEALKAFQQQAGLAVTGRVDEATWKHLTSPMTDVLRPIAPEGRPLSAMIVAYGMQHLAQHPIEIGGENRGPWVRLYMDGQDGSNSLWCVGFATFIIRQAALSIGTTPPYVGKDYNYNCNPLADAAKGMDLHVRWTKTNAPPNVAPGSLFVVLKASALKARVQKNSDYKSPYRHVGIVTGVHEDGFSTVEGNTDARRSENGFEVAALKREYDECDFILLPEQAPLRILGARAADITATNGVIVWTTNRPASSWLKCDDGAPRKGPTTTSHHVMLTGLEPGMEHFVEITCAQAENAQSTTAALTFTTAPLPNEQSTLARSLWTNLVWALKNKDLGEFELLKPIMLGQWALESGRGTSELARQALNFGGLKYRTDLPREVPGTTCTYYDEGRGEADKNYFRCDTEATFVELYLAFIDRPNYDGWREAAKRGGEDFIQHLVDHGYVGVSQEKRAQYVSSVMAMQSEMRKLLDQTKPPAPQNPPDTPVENKLCRGKGVFLDIGHGPKPNKNKSVFHDPGATREFGGKEIEEHALNVIAAVAAERVIQAAGVQCDVFDDAVVTDEVLNSDNLAGAHLNAIGKMADGYDVFISMHHGTSPQGDAQGAECLYETTVHKPEDIDLAKMVAKELFEELKGVIPKMNNRGGRAQGLAVLKGARKTEVRAAVLPECYFFDSVKSNHEEYSRRAGEAVGRAVIKWLQKNAT